MNGINHPFDMSISADKADFMIEEMPESKQYLSDCLATASSASTVACGCSPSTAASLACIGSIISCGKNSSY
jgi:hypothetical protein